MFKVLATIGFVGTFTTLAFGGATIDGQKNSSDFTYQYEADVLPDSAGLGFVLNDPNSRFADIVSIGSGVLTIDTVNNPDVNDALWYEITGGSGTTWDVAGGTALTMEIRVRVNATNSGTIGAAVGLKDSNSNGNLMMFKNHIIMENTTTATDPNDDGFHVFRVATFTPDLTSAGQIYRVWRDGVQIGIDAPQNTNNLSPRLRLGDFLSSSAEVNFEIDYLRWDITGAYEPVPVPEPASLTLIGVAGLLMLRRH